MPLIFSDQSLLRCNTLGLPAQAAMAVLADEAQIPSLCDAVKSDQGLFILGGGSNVVVQDSPRRQVLRVALQGVRLWQETPEHWLVEASAGESWHGFVTHCLAQGWPGLENLALIPGTVGAAPVQNIGAYGLEIDQCLHSIVVWDLQAGHECVLHPADCGFAYRDSRFKRAGAGRWLIVRVRFALPKAWVPRLDYPDLQAHPALQEDKPTPKDIYAAVCDIRRRKLPDPAVLGNAGSFFKNPLVPAELAATLRQRFPDIRWYPQADGQVKLAAGWLIEQAGWKGRRLGPVGMHQHQSLVLVNYGGARAADVQTLAQAVRQAVQDRFGVCLEQEPVLLD
ncbi:UDP-N-acetylmuramate dehydrogenase [Castellaniella sp.]|uniref:UDP-N-acetylmuramate dehydrogenase n=1 Tax=Castellaniella sp. TaxID=1955812 RepID=UPI002AFF4BF3|nr:UDP-N-acetylmuramate dehydrogenase [Castellaniella sp.]